MSWWWSTRSSTAPSVHEVVKLAGFLTRWSHRAVERSDRDLLLDDVQTCASVVTRCAQPQRKDWMSLGPCPLEYEHPESGQLEQCPGEVRSYGDDAEGESWATCTACGQEAVASWWEGKMFGPERDAPLTTEEAITFVHRTSGRTVKRTTLQMWVNRGDLASCGKDDQGRRLSTREAIVWALDRQEKRRGERR